MQQAKPLRRHLVGQYGDACHIPAGPVKAFDQARLDRIAANHEDDRDRGDGGGGLAKLRLARREGRTLIYAGRVGTGWDHKTARAIRRALEPLARSTSPLTTPIKKKEPA